MTPWLSESFVFAPIQRKLDAIDLRLQHLRATVLFAALAAEGYANEYLAAQLSGRELEAADRLRTVDKFVLGPRLAGLPSVIAYDCDPGGSLIALFKTRDALVHPSPEEGVYAIDLEPDDKRPYEPKSAARYLIQVAHAVILLNSGREGVRPLFPANRIWEERSVLENHVTSIGAGLIDLPAEDSPPVRDLMAQMHERASTRARREHRGDASNATDA